MFSTELQVIDNNIKWEKTNTFLLTHTKFAFLTHIFHSSSSDFFLPFWSIQIQIVFKVNLTISCFPPCSFYFISNNSEPLRRTTSGWRQETCTGHVPQSLFKNFSDLSSWVSRWDLTLLSCSRYDLNYLVHEILEWNLCIKAAHKCSWQEKQLHRWTYSVSTGSSNVHVRFNKKRGSLAATSF